MTPANPPPASNAKIAANAPAFRARSSRSFWRLAPPDTQRTLPTARPDRTLPGKNEHGAGKRHVPPRASQRPGASVRSPRRTGAGGSGRPSRELLTRVSTSRGVRPRSSCHPVPLGGLSIAQGRTLLFASWIRSSMWELGFRFEGPEGRRDPGRLGSPTGAARSCRRRSRQPRSSIPAGGVSQASAARASAGRACADS